MFNHSVQSLTSPITTSVPKKNGKCYESHLLPEILFMTSYPPKECGLATYSQDLLRAMNNKFNQSFLLSVCALEFGDIDYTYPDEVKYVLNTLVSQEYVQLADKINKNESIQLVIVQHEFGFFKGLGEADLLKFLYKLLKPIVLVFHTVLPNPDPSFRANVVRLAAVSQSIVVMTKSSAQILQTDYAVPEQKIQVIAHGIHLVSHVNKDFLKEKYGLANKRILSTFGLLSSGKSIETTLNALPSIINDHSDVVFLIIGKTHPGVIQSEGEKYRAMLEFRVDELKLNSYVQFINRYLPLETLLEYLQLTDIYLFTSKDPNQAVSGTFSYAMSCGCPIISTPIPQAKEVLHEDTGILIDFQNSKQLSDGVNRLMSDDTLRLSFRSTTLQEIASSAWENSAIMHALLFKEIIEKPSKPTALHGASSLYELKAYPTKKISLQYRLPDICLDHVKKLTTDFGMIQFSKINEPDIDSGYTLDDVCTMN
jgi:glycosyltransferase involved in cell wall biosynthesis